MTRVKSMKSLAMWIGVAVAAGLGAGLLDPVEPNGGGILAYLVLLVPGAVALWVAWRWISKGRGPSWLPYAIGVAVLLRLGVGLLLARALPVYGYPDSEPHQAGYFYLDAWLRDGDAWDLAVSQAPLGRAFSERSGSDQYGGMTYMSAALYRSFSSDAHRPLLIVALGSVVSGLAVLFTWAFADGMFGARAARVAGWGIALYPEAVLLGATQMREPFLIAALAAVLYVLYAARQGRVRASITVALIALALVMPISPPYALILAAVLIAGLVWEGKRTAPRMIIMAAAIGAVGLLLTVSAWGKIADAPQGSPGELLDWWLNSGARFELIRLERGSGFVQKLFDTTPQWAHMPMATAYGLVQPFLPATLMDSTSLPFPRAIGIFRGLGWFVLLPFLIYAPLAATRAAGWRSLAFFLPSLVWVTAILVSFRLAGDFWDNPRARAVFISVQVSVAGWSWTRARVTQSPWLRRISTLVAGTTLIFLQWYAGRYYQTPQLNLNATVALVAAFVILLLGGAVYKDRTRGPRLTATPPEV